MRCISKRCIDPKCTKDADCEAWLGTGAYCAQETPEDPLLCLANPRHQYGEICRKTETADTCDTGLFCLVQQAGKQGYCTKTCSEGKCAQKVGETAIQASCEKTSAFKEGDVCVHRCNLKAPRCAKGLTCQDVQGSGFCLLP